MVEWSSIRLEDIAADQKGSIAIGPFGSAMKADTYSQVGVPIIRGTNISSTRAWKGDWVFIPERFADSMLRCVANPDDIVFPHRGSIGEVAIVPPDRDRYFLSSSLMKVRIDQSRADPLFVYYYFRSLAGRNEILRFASQVGTPGIGQPLASLRQFSLPLPPLKDQKAIASVLCALDDKIELNRRMNETLEESARAIFRDWFIDFGPIRTKMALRGEDPQKQNTAPTPYLAPDLWSLFPDRLDDEGKPEGWVNRPFSEFLEIIGGGTPKTSVGDYWNGEIPWFSVVDTPSDGCGFVYETQKYITARGAAESSVRLIQTGTTIISARGTIGNLAIAAREMAFNQSCYALKGKNQIGNWLVYLAAQQMVAQLQSLAHGSVFSTITRTTFDAVSLAIANDAILHRFDDLVGPLFERQKANSAEYRTLAATRDLLLPKLMSGEVRVRDAEKLVGASQ